MQRLKVVPCPTTELSFTNRAVLNPHDCLPDVEHISVNYPNSNDNFIFSIATDKLVGQGCIAFNASGRKWASLMTEKTIEVLPFKFDPRSQCLHTITFEVDFVNRGKAENREFNTDDMARQFSERFPNQAFTINQLFGFVYYINNNKVIFELKVVGMEAMKLDADTEGDTPFEIGLSTPNTVAIFKPAEGSNIRLAGSQAVKAAAPQIFSRDWDFSNMGIGGLGEQFNEIFWRAFAERLLPPSFIEDCQMELVKGILLYGPPGCGKTLIARQIAKMLLSREPKIVNGPEVLNKYVGESEANIRALFKEAEDELAKSGLYSGLHVIIFDEFDAIAKQRGNSASTSGVGDNVVNQLLSKIDGVNALTNVLLIGMTNRRDLIDEAILRPGRFEVQIEIGLPDEKGRLEILKIHTKRLQQKGFLDPAIDLEDLAARTKNYTGAELAALVKAARSLAVNRTVKPDPKRATEDEVISKIWITPDDFNFGIKNVVKPALGASDDQLKRLTKPITIWDPSVETMMQKMHKLATELGPGGGKPYYFLLLGEPGSGLTTLAVNMASWTNFPFIRIYQAKETASRGESAKAAHLEKLFQDGARSEQSCIVIDNLPKILDYCHIGPRFSLTTTAVLTENKSIDVQKTMIVICTCNSNQALIDMQLRPLFSYIIEVPSLTRPDQVRLVLAERDVLTASQIEDLTRRLASFSFKIGVGKLEEFINVAKSETQEDRPRFLLEMIQDEMRREEESSRNSAIRF